MENNESAIGSVYESSRDIKNKSIENSKNGSTRQGPDEHMYIVSRTGTRRDSDIVQKYGLQRFKTGKEGSSKNKTNQSENYPASSEVTVTNPSRLNVTKDRMKSGKTNNT